MCSGMSRNLNAYTSEEPQNFKLKVTLFFAGFVLLVWIAL